MESCYLYEKLICQCSNSDLKVIEENLKPIGTYGLCVNNIIFLEKTLNNNLKACVLAEELGHYYKSYGNILDLKNVTNMQSENKGRAWAFEKLFGLEQIIEVHNKRLNSKYEAAEYLNITEAFIDEALNYYRKKYGTYVNYKNYTIGFIPNLYVIQKINENNSFI